MKNLIVLLAVLPLALALICFVGYLQINGSKENLVRETVYEAVEDASQEGYFTARNITYMQGEIADVMGIASEEVEVRTSSRIKYRPETITYEVEVPIEKVVPVNKLFGISDANNTGAIVIEGEIMSERLVP